MDNSKNENNYKKPKIIFIIISIIIVLFTLTGYMIKAKEGGAIRLTSFISFYVYMITTIVAIFMVIINKKANILIIISFLII